jgi:hypothetical protein
LPHADTEAMQLHLDEISQNVAEGAHAVLLLDRAGWHTTGNLTCPPTSRRSCSPPAPPNSTRSRTSGSISANWLSNRLFETYDAIIDAACEAWMKLIDMPETLTSIGMREWAHVGQSL